MPTVQELLRQAEEYRRLAVSCTTPGLSELLLTIAGDMERAAARLNATTSIQQQQQIQPNKNDKDEK